jgi:hypothetical protein
VVGRTAPIVLSRPRHDRELREVVLPTYVEKRGLGLGTGGERIVGQAARLRRYSRGLTPRSRLKAALSA